MTINYPEEFKSKLTSSHSDAPYSDYVNAKGTDKSSYFHFERETDGSFLGYATERPIWNVRHTLNGYDYKVVGCVTAFDNDEVRCTFHLPNEFDPYGEDKDFVAYTASGSHPFEAFENAIEKYVARKGE
tara:strand:+ start:290 stop:676 length:387 start_codon:yes stop_codon:yes gene_type:complete